MDALKKANLITSKIFTLHYDVPGCNMDITYCSAIELGGVQPLRILSESLDDITFVKLPWNQGIWAVNITATGFGFSVYDVLNSGFYTGPAHAVISSREPYILVPGYLWDDVK